MLLLRYRRTVLHFWLELYHLRQSPPMVPRYPSFPCNAQLTDRYNHRERGGFIHLHAQFTTLYETAQSQADENLPGALRKWRTERLSLAGSAADPTDPSLVNGTRIACERIVVFSKRDLVPEWGIEVWASRTSGHPSVCLTRLFLTHPLSHFGRQLRQNFRISPSYLPVGIAQKT